MSIRMNTKARWLGMIRTLNSRVKFPQEVEKLHSHFEWIHRHLGSCIQLSESDAIIKLFGTEGIDKHI